MSNERIWQVIALAGLCCLIVMTGLLVRREFFVMPAAEAAPFLAPDRTMQPPVPVDDWARVSAAGHRIGPHDAPVTIVEFSDFECPFCARFATETFPALQARFPGQVALLYRHWPLPNHRMAYPAARAAECAAAQDRFQALHDVLFAQRESLQERPLADFARDAGVPDLPSFERCIEETGSVAAIERDIAEARRIGGRGTPTLVINGMLMRAPYSDGMLARQIQAALEEAGR